MSVVDKIRHYQRNLEKCCDNEDRILHCISKLYKLPVTVQHLQETGVGRTVNGLRKYEGNVGNAAKALVFKWKVMVADEDTSDGEEEETCIPDVPEDHSDNHISPKLEYTEENMSSLSDQSSDAKHKHKGIKSESAMKHSTVHSSKMKTEEEKHEKIRHSSKHHSRSDKKSKESRSSDNNLKMEEAYNLTKQNHSKMDDLRKTTDKITEVNKENNKKRKQDNSDSSKKEIKKRRLSDSKSDDEKSQLSISGKGDSSLKSSSVQLEKVKVKDETIDTEKQSIKREMEKQSKSSSSNKSKSKQQPSNKVKDNSEKQKHKKEEHASYKKSDTKRDSNQHSSKQVLKSKSSSSNNKDEKSKDRNQKKERKDDRNRDERKKETKIRLMQEMNGDEGIDCNSGASFAEALGMCTIPQPSRKRTTHNVSPNPNRSIKTEPPMSPPINNRKLPVIKTEPECDDSPNSLSLLASNVKLEPLSVDLVSTLPEISPNYKPLPYINPVHRKEEVKAIDEIIYVKNQRTKVYSGNKVGYTSVPTLYDMCIRVLIENIDALEVTGGVPFDILKPVLERATPDQLFILEHYNPYLMEDTDVLWQFHCNREFKKNERQEMESWREMYMRCLDEREAKLKTLTANIKQSIDKSVPVRSTKLAYVDNIVKPPRNVLKKQAKYGTANATPATVSSVKKRLTVGGGVTNATNIAVPPPPMSRFKASTSNMKKTKAPLMAKALQLIKGRYKR